MNKPWIKEGILVSIRHKQKLYINFLKTGTEIEKILYKTYANKLSKSKPYQKSFTYKKRLSTLVMICVNFVHYEDFTS